jgi:hypothetical protein
MAVVLFWDMLLNHWVKFLYIYVDAVPSSSGTSTCWKMKAPRSLGTSSSYYPMTQPNVPKCGFLILVVFLLSHVPCCLGITLCLRSFLLRLSVWRT